MDSATTSRARARAWFPADSSSWNSPLRLDFLDRHAERVVVAPFDLLGLVFGDVGSAGLEDGPFLDREAVHGPLEGMAIVGELLVDAASAAGGDERDLVFGLELAFRGSGRAPS